MIENKHRILTKVAWLRSRLRVAKMVLQKAKESGKLNRIRLARVELKRVKRIRTEYIRMGWWKNVRAI